MSSRAKTAVIYARVSDRRQAEEELPIASQVEQCRRRCDDLGARVDRVFLDEGISGRSDLRSGFQSCIAYCEISSPDYLVVWSTSRFARNRLDAAIYKRRLQAAGVSIIYVNLNIDRETDSGWLTEGMMELFDEYASRMISADTRRSMYKNARDGYHNGGNPPYGYEAVPADDNPRRKRLKIRPSEAEIVRDIFSIRISGVGAKSIAMLLNDRGLKMRGRRWSTSSVLRILKSDAVVGRVVFGRTDNATRKVRPRSQWIVVQSHAPIIDQRTWDTVQRMISDAAPSASKGSPRSTYVFTGILCCQDGTTMQIESGLGRSGKRYWYYNCRSAQRGQSRRNRRISARAFDEWMIDVVLDQILTEGALRDIIDDIREACDVYASDRRERRRSLERSLTAVRERNNKIYDLLELHGQDAPNLGDLTARLRGNNAEIKLLEEKLAAIDAETGDVEPPDVDVHALAETLRGIVKSTTNPKKLRHFFGSFIDRIVLYDNTVSVDYRPECIITQNSAVLSESIWLPGEDSNL